MARSPECRTLALNPIINEVSKQFLEPHSDGYQLHFTSAINIGPGETEQILHRDRGVWVLHSKKNRNATKYGLGNNRFYKREWCYPNSSWLS